MASEPKTIGAVERTLAIVQALERLGGAGASEVARELSLSKSTVYTHLNTLHANGYLVKSDGSYSLSCRFLRLGSTVQQSFDLYGRGKPVVDELATETGERTNLVVEEAGRGTCLHAADATGSTDIYMSPGERWPMHATATGKAILAHLPVERVDDIVDEHGLPSLTEHTITTREALDDELETIRQTGVSFDEQEAVEGLRCLSSPVLVDGNPLGSVSVSGPARQFTDSDRERELVDALREAVNVVQLKFVFS
ncbi:IclR family transcriptional regulator [Halogeometricum limi]|uniref:Transcriptional regulator, IclR family n=1 Tax=Halogeometricum limi TaxID=555875 RepID=A0A1I6IBF0_9EURY|nr:IclR family transcriptional regulator [Halogeometricum limi]SFR64018.1 transcriptional regulator, IclR family [Halogeometricum limi]